MVWPDARRVIAVVANEHARRNLPEVDAPRKDVRAYRFIEPLDAPVSMHVPRTGPFPAPIALLHVVPKPILGGGIFGANGVQLLPGAHLLMMSAA